MSEMQTVKLHDCEYFYTPADAQSIADQLAEQGVTAGEWTNDLPTEIDDYWAIRPGVGRAVKKCHVVGVNGCSVAVEVFGQRHILSVADCWQFQGPIKPPPPPVSLSGPINQSLDKSTGEFEYRITALERSRNYFRKQLDKIEEGLEFLKDELRECKPDPFS